MGKCWFIQVFIEAISKEVTLSQNLKGEKGPALGRDYTVSLLTDQLITAIGVPWECDFCFEGGIICVPAEFCYRDATGVTSARP